jgi:hypothetical protein
VLRPPPSAALRMLEFLIVEVVLHVSLITLEMLTIPIHPGGEEDDVDGKETEDDTSYVPHIRLKYTGLKWRRLVNVVLITSRSRSGISDSILSHDTSCSTFGTRPPTLQIFTKPSFRLGKVVYLCIGKEGISQTESGR